MTVKFKDGVKLDGIEPEALHILVTAGFIWRETFHGVDCVCTSALDSRHMTGSLHYKGLAVDLRTYTLPGGYVGEGAQKATKLLKDRLGSDYDVVLESDHLHVEYDPK